MCFGRTREFFVLQSQEKRCLRAWNTQSISSSKIPYTLTKTVGTEGQSGFVSVTIITHDLKEICASVRYSINPCIFKLPTDSLCEKHKNIIYIG